MFGSKGKISDYPGCFKFELRELVSIHILDQTRNELVVKDRLYKLGVVLLIEYFAEVDKAEMPVENVWAFQAFDDFLQGNALN